MKPFLCLAVLIFGCGALLAQATSPASATPPDAGADAQVVEGPPARPKTPAELKDQAWTMLTTAVTDTKHAELQIQCLGALGTMGANARSLGLIRDAMSDKDVDIRVAALLAAGQTKAATMTTDMRRLLDDKEPAAAYTAALTLWKMHDRSGEDILMAIVDGDRGANPGLVHGAEHQINRELHNPAAMAKYGALQGASMLLGPFGIGIAAFEYMHKNGGDSARVSAVEAIAENRTEPIRRELVAALGDKDLGVRAAAAKALAPYRDQTVSPQIAKLFLDPKPPVRLTAAAAYLISTGVAPGSPKEGTLAASTGKGKR